MRRMPMIAMLMVALAMSSDVVNTAQRRSNRADEDAIRRVIADQTAAFNRHEVDTALFTEDADFVNVGGTWLKGAAEIERGRRSRFQTALKNARISLLEQDVRFIRPDVAIAHVLDEITGMTGPTGAPVPPQRELSIRVLVKDNGRWLVTAFQNTTAASAAPQPR